ncbi:uncharacterized protein LOC123548821 [Mercenaria mercenaria]|uniref:uncharacterized protein LOC123548821 n=1 Tax=Mercenaria mercenaria TaxID=6596 RepID=UPI00234E7F5C|nr:uncharacterized protein LOC123548821 [Mercenaria mercenaria]
MEERICELRMEIVRLIKHPAVLQFLVPHVINQVNAKEIKRLYDISTERANHRLLDLLIRSDEPGKWTSFQHALEHSHYPYLVALLKTTNTTSYNQQRQIIEIFAPFLERSLNPLDVLDKLYQRDIIDEPDKELVHAEQTNRGPIAAAMILLDIIQTHLAPEMWYKGFLEALYENGYEHLVQEIDPDFCEKRNHKADHLNNETDISAIKETVDLVEAINTDNKTISENINRFRSVITETLDIPSIVNVLIPTVILADKRDELLQTYEYDQVKATGQLLEYVISSGNGEVFIRCLERSDYQYLARLLRNKGSKGHNGYCQKVIQIFSSNIQQQISTPELLSRLVEQNVINQRDMELIQSEHRRKGNTAATVVLLDCIQTHLSPEEWYMKFLHALMATSQDHIVDIIEPDFTRNPDQFMIKMKQIDHSEESCESAQDDPFEDEIAAMCKIKQAYFESKLKAEAQIIEEQKYMIKFISDKFEQLKMEVKEKAQSFDTDLANHKEAVLRLKERNHSYPQNEAIENELEILKQRYPQLSGNTKIEVKFERNLTLHFLKSVGYVSEIRPADLQKDLSNIDVESHHGIPLTLDNIRLPTDERPHAPISDEGSSFLQITVPPFSDDETMSLESDLEKNEEQIENDIASGTIEIIVSKKVPALNQLSLKDIIAISGKEIAGICKRTNTLLIIETENFDIVSRIPLKNKNSNKLALLNKNTVAVMSPDVQPLIIISFDEPKQVLYEWNCESDKCILVSHKNCLYVICLGHHLHVYRLDTGKQDIYMLGSPTDEPWYPKYAILNASGEELFISDYDCVYCFKILDKERVQEQWKYFDSNKSLFERQLFIGISIYDENILLLDKNNNSVLRLSSKGGFYRDEIVSSSFSDCDLLAFYPQENLIHLVSYRYKEYKKVKLVSNSLHTDCEEEFDPYVNVV